jgi:zinc protease
LLVAATLIGFTPSSAWAGEPPHFDGVIEIEAPRLVRPATTFENDPLAVRQYVLDNGLTVLLSEDHTRPEVFGAVAVRTGGANDPADDTGMAHYLEHMLFKGTTQLGTSNWQAEAPLQARLVELYDQLRVAKDDAERARIHAEIATTVEQTYAYVIPNELERMLGEIGSTGVNAFTSEDETVYHNTFPASQIATWLEIYAHRFQDPVFRLFPTELEAVYEEKNISMDHFEYAIYRAFIERAWPGHPYGTQEVIGEVEHLKRPSLSAMRRYFDTYYVPSNMALVLSGDFDSDAILPLIEASFGRWKAGPEPQGREGVVEPFGEDERYTVRLTPIRAGAIAFRTVGIGHPDYPVIRLACELVHNEQRSGFLDELVDRGQLMFTFPTPTTRAEHGLEGSFYVPRVLFQRFGKAERLVAGAYERVATGDFDEAEMDGLRDNMLHQQDREFESNEDRALAMVEAFTSGGGWAATLRNRERLRTLTKAELVEVAAEYFGDEPMMLRSRVGKPKKTRLDKPAIPPVKPQRGVQSEFYRRITAKPTPMPELVTVDPQIDRSELAPGVMLAVNGNPYNQLFAFDIELGVGTDGIPELDVGAAYLDRLAPEGRSVAEFKQELAKLGVTLDVFVHRFRFTVHIEGPDEHFEQAVALAQALLERPELDKSAFNALRKEAWTEDRVMRESAESVANALGQYVLWGRNSNYLHSHGPGEMRRLGPKRTLEAVAEARGYARTYRYVGPRELARVEAVVRDTFTHETGLEPAVPYRTFERQLPDEPTVYFLAKKGSLQSHIYFAFEGEPVPRDQRANADAYNEFMGGAMSSIVFQEIREFRALAYSAWADFRRDDDLVQDSHFLGFVGCQADKTEEAIDAMLEVIQNFPARPENLPSVQASLIRELETKVPTFRRLQLALEAWQRVGYESDPRPEMLAGYQALRFEDVQALFERQIAGKPVIVMIVGDPKRIDTEMLSKWGKVVRVKPSEVFSD